MKGNKRKFDAMLYDSSIIIDVLNKYSSIGAHSTYTIDYDTFTCLEKFQI